MTHISATAEFTSTFSPESGGVAERAHQTILSISNTLRLGAKLPKAAWAEMVKTACFIHSYLPCRSNPGCVSPSQMMTGRVPDVSFLRAIGCTAYVHVHKPQRHDVLDPRAEKGTLLGYPSQTKGYRILMSTSPFKIVETMHVTFAEQLNFTASLIHSLPDRDGAHYFEEEVEPSVLDDPGEVPPVVDLLVPADDVLGDDEHYVLPAPVMPPLVPTRNIVPRQHVPIQRDPYPVRERRQPSHLAKAVRYSKATQVQLPSRVKFRKDGQLDPMLRESMTLAINELYECGAIELVPRLPTDRPVKTIWVHQDKRDNNGQLLRIKSRVCPQGFRFRPGTDFDPDEVSSSTPQVQTIMLGMTIEVQRGLFTEHLDAVNCFQRESNLPLDSRITIQPTDGFDIPEGFVIRMINALQGSPQAGRIWEDKANSKLLADGFHQSTTDPCFYHRWDGEVYTQIVRTVDDFRISSDSFNVLQEVSSNLKKQWKMTEQINKPWNGMSINHDRTSGQLTISMKQSIEDILNEFGMTDCTTVTTPAAPATKLIKPNSPINDGSSAFPYRSAVGELLWLARTGRPDILYAVNQLTKFCHDWDTSHVTAAKRVIRYLKGTIDLKLRFSKGTDLECVIFADADHAGEPEENVFPMCSLSGLVAYMKGIGPFFCSVNLEKTISQSTAEAEYKTIGRGGKVAATIRQFLGELGFPQSNPTIIYNDNQAAIAIAKKPYCTSATRHMKIKYHYIRELIKDGSVKIEYIPTTEMVADIMTKALDRGLFEKFRRVLLGCE